MVGRLCPEGSEYDEKQRGDYQETGDLHSAFAENDAGCHAGTVSDVIEGQSVVES